MSGVDELTYALGAPGESERFDAVDRLVRPRLGLSYSDDFAGAVVLVAHRGTVRYHRAFGHAEALRLHEGTISPIPEPRPMRTDTIFDLASITKVMAGTSAIMKLVDEGEVELDAEMRGYLPGLGADIGTITVRELLAHRTGLSWQPTGLHRTAAGRDSVIEYLGHIGWPARSRGEYRYSDINFMFLGLIAERVSSERLDTFLARQLFGPLGMSDAGYLPSPGLHDRIAATEHGNPFELEMIGRMEADGSLDRSEPYTDWRTFRFRDHTLVGEVDDGNCWYGWDGVAGHAGLFATAMDVAIYAQLMLNRGTYAGYRFVRPDTVDEFVAAPFGDPRALGAQRNHLPALPEGLGHSGFTGTRFAYSYADEIIVVLLSNRQHKYLEHPIAYPDLDPLWGEIVHAAVEATSEHPSAE